SGNPGAVQTPLREKLTSLKNTIASAQQQTNASYVTEMPSADEIKQFSDAAQTALHNLSFQARRAILLNTVEKIVGTPQELQVHGYIPVKDHVEFKTSNRHGLNAGRLPQVSRTHTGENIAPSAYFKLGDFLTYRRPLALLETIQHLRALAEQFRPGLLRIIQVALQ
uniref:hypothetical protein n=1 Tax=Bradyrhizobium liaoningense TaxID=43992 RepID=UPI000555E361